jgi:arginine-tRNA-protein transferase
LERPAVYLPEHFALYEIYVRSRHPSGSMAEDVTPQSYSDFLIGPWGGETLLLEMRLDQRLVGVAVTDRLPGALSAVYTFFDPELSRRSPGSFAILQQVELARKLGLDSLYLGYWIEECRKMSYKDGYRPIEALIADQWLSFHRGDAINWQN